MANFLAKNLTTVNNKFVDNRTVTATPIPYIETILPGKTGISGWVGTVSANNITMPEAGAYIYIYVNGFLINPPELNDDGSFKNLETAIISNSNGDWSTGVQFFNILPQLQYGQTLTLRAKAPLKKMSDISIPYAIGSTPTPVDIGITDPITGKIRPPYAGEDFVTGRISYWFNKQGQPNFDCNNHLYMYIDGIHEGNYGTVLGEVFKNEIRGVNSSYPIYDNLNNQVLSLLVNNNQVDIPIKNLNPASTSILFGEQSGINLDFFCFVPDTNVTIKIYKNGIRLQEQYDYILMVDPVTLKATIHFFPSALDSAKFGPLPTDNLIAVFQYAANNYILQEVPQGLIDGNNDTFMLSNIPLYGTEEVYLNGVHLNPISQPGIPPDYVMDRYNIVFLNNIPQIGDKVLVDYQVNSSKKQLTFVEIPIGLIDGINDSFIYSIPQQQIGKPQVYLNGLLQKEGKNFDYALLYDNLIKFTPWNIPQIGDTVLVTFSASPILLSTLISYLNNTKQFKANCLTASTFSTIPLKLSIDINGIKNGENQIFSMAELNGSINVRIFKNGQRLQEAGVNIHGDYSLNYDTQEITFSVAPRAGDALIAIINYSNNNFVVGETQLGEINGANTVFHTTLIPKATTVHLFYNGLRLLNNIDFSVTQNTITMITFTPQTGDVLLVDYEPIFGFDTLTSSTLPTGSIDGNNKIFTFEQKQGTLLQVYKNGLLLNYLLDYIINQNQIIFMQAPHQGDTLFLEFMSLSLITQNQNDQIRIISPNKLELKLYNGEMDTTQKIIFGTKFDLYPGKDENGDFYFWFNQKTGQWKWSWYDPVTKQKNSFKTGQHISARAKNDTPFIIKI